MLLLNTMSNPGLDSGPVKDSLGTTEVNGVCSLDGNTISKLIS